MATHFSGPVVSDNGLEVTGTASVSGAATLSTSVAVGSGGTAITYVKKGTIAIDLPSIAAAEVGEATATLTGAAVGDVVILNAPAAGLTAGLAICEVRVSATDTIKVRAANGTAAPINEASATCTYVLIRS